jgi:uncharacterized protein
MLTGKLVRVKNTRDRIIPAYLDHSDGRWLKAAQEMIDLFRGKEQCTRGELEEEVDEAFGDLPNPLVYQGLAKLLEDRCEFETISGHPPEQLREAVFLLATKRRQAEAQRPGQLGLNRQAILAEVANQLGVESAVVDQGLFADLKSEQRLQTFKDISPEHLLQRYNVALAQAVLLRSTGVQALIRGESPARWRQLLRQAKFHRLVCAIEAAGKNAYMLRLDGPLSLFTATNKYGLQLALFLPTILLCRDFELRAELRWGAERKPKNFSLTPRDGLISHAGDTGMYVPPELAMFVELFRKKITGWDIAEQTDILPLGNSLWVPDYRLVHLATHKTVYVEVLGFWRRSSVEAHLARLRQHAKVPFVLAVSDQLHVEEADLDSLPAGIHRFRNMPLPDEIVKLAEAQLE